MSTSGIEPIHKPQLHHIPRICLKPMFKITLYYCMWIFLAPKSRTPCLLIPICVNKVQAKKRLSGSHHCSHSQSSTMQAWYPSNGIAYIGGKAIFMQSPLHLCQCNTKPPENSEYTCTQRSMHCIHNFVFSKLWLCSFMRRNMSPSKVCVHSEMHFRVELCHLNINGGIPLQQPNHFHHRNHK